MTALLRALALGAAGMFCVAGSAHAAALWNLHGVTFDDGTVAEGSFVFDEATVDCTNWDIRVEAGAFLPAYDYLPGVDGGFLGIHSEEMADFVAFPLQTSGRYIRLDFVAPLTDAGGHVTAARVPEPASLALLGLGLVGLGAVRRGLASREAATGPGLAEHDDRGLRLPHLHHRQGGDAVEQFARGEAEYSGTARRRPGQCAGKRYCQPMTS